MSYWAGGCQKEKKKEERREHKGGQNGEKEVSIRHDGQATHAQVKCSPVPECQTAEGEITQKYSDSKYLEFTAREVAISSSCYKSGLGVMPQLLSSQINKP